MTERDDRPNDIAIVGMACRFPGAASLDAFWGLLDTGREGITDLDPDPNDADYVARAPILDDVAGFDAAFFDIPAAEAALMDPQHRLFLETAWTALEHAGEPPAGFDGAIGCFAGAGLNSYLINQVMPALTGRDPAALYQALSTNAGDFLATRVAYKLGLTGPALTVQSACSTSLAAVHLACQSLLAGECDMALAGGVTVRVPHRIGYRYQPGMIFSPDGHCRPFAADAAGTVPGSGVGIVVLRRFADAVAAGDTVHAVILGSAINNDGARKAGFSAPSAEGQARVIAEALAVAGISAADIDYIEAHGTGTPLGDPIEVEALNRVFAGRSPGRCGIGSVKSNIGHLDAAAGIAGLIKTVLCLKHRRLVPTLHAAPVNPSVPFDAGPFLPVLTAAPWPGSPDRPRRAGVSSFGIGGTNAHVVLEEPPPPPAVVCDAGPYVLALSARSADALAEQATALARILETPGADLAAMQTTLAIGRTPLRHRRTLVVAAQRTAPVEIVGTAGETPRPVAFLFPGQGAQYPGMALALAERYPVFRRALDHGAAVLRQPLGGDLRELLRTANASALAQTALAQPLTLAVSWALAQLWRDWGVVPTAVIGHSLGEYAAACAAGVLDPDDALRLVAARGRLMQALPPGAMLAVPLSEEDLAADRPSGIELAVVNGPRSCVVAGPLGAIAEAERYFAARDIATQRLVTSHAFHSAMMDPVLDAFAAEVARVRLSPPRLPLYSNLTGNRLNAQDATNPAYWVDHLRRPVRFAEGLAALLTEPDVALLECGPGRVLTGLAARHPARPEGAPVVASLTDRHDETGSLAEAVGRLWVAGVAIDWQRMTDRPTRRIVLPGTAFQHHRHWLDTTRPPAAVTVLTPTWTRGLPAPAGNVPTLVFADAAGNAVPAAGAATRVEFPAIGRQADDFATLLDALPQPPERVIMGWTLDHPATDAGVFPLIRALGRHGRTVDLTVVTHGAVDVTGTEPLIPETAALSGLLRVAAQEFPTVRCRLVDAVGALPGALARELSAVPRRGEPLVALRGGHRWLPRYEPLPLPAAPAVPADGVWLIVGGLGAVGSALAGAVADLGAKTLMLVQRRLPTPASDGDEEMDRRRRRLAVLKAKADTRLLSADAGDASALRCVVAEIERTHGRLAGIIHAAGTKNMAALAGLDGADVDRAVRVRLAMLEALDAAVGARTLPVLVTSSLSAVLGALGLAAYAAAHAALDAWVERRNRGAAAPWTVIDWDNWRLQDMAGPLLPESEPGLDAGQGRNVIARLLAGGVTGRVVVCAGDLEERLHRWVGGGVVAASDGPPASHQPRPAIATPYRAPATPAEKTLAAIWQDLLGIEAIGSDDDLFELGTDSLLGIQFAVHAGHAGLGLGLADLFAHPTVGELASVVQGPATDGGESADSFPPTPIQRWFFDGAPDQPGRWAQAVLFEIRDPRYTAVLAAALTALEQRHAVLRLRIATDGPWRIADDATPDLLETIDATPQEALARLVATLDPVRGPLWRAAVLPATHQLLLCIHHLAVDLPSWPVLAADLDRLCTALARGDIPILPPAGTAFAAYAHALDRLTHEPAVLAERDYWRAALADIRPLPFDNREVPDRVADEADWSGRLEAERTAALRRRPSRSGRPFVHDALLAAVAQAVGRAFGIGRVVVDLEGHGRLPPLPLDLGHSVGWFTTLHPMSLPTDPATSPAAAVARVGDLLDRVFARGLGYGLLRYILHDFGDLPEPDIAFLFIGDSTVPANPESGLVPLSTKLDGRDPQGRRRHALEVTGALIGETLEVRVMYPGRRHRAAAIGTLGQDILKLLETIAKSSETGMPVYDDLAIDADLSDEEIADLLQDGEIE